MKSTSKTIVIDRLARALAAHGVELKRAQLFEIAASAMGVRNREVMDRAFADGEFDPPAAGVVGRMETAVGAIAVLIDPKVARPFAIEEASLPHRTGDKRDRFGVSPYGGLVDLSSIDPAALPDMRIASVGTSSEVRVYGATVTHRHGEDQYIGGSHEELQGKLVSYATQWWSEARRGNPRLPEETDGMTPAQIIDGYFKAMEPKDFDEGESVEYFEDVIEVPVPVSTQSEMPATRRHSHFVAGMVCGYGGEPILWWNARDGEFGALCDATVYPSMDGPLPIDPAMPDSRGQIAWYQLPYGDYGDAPTTVIPEERVSASRITFLTNRECEGQEKDARVRDYLRWLTPGTIDIVGAPGPEAEMGYLADVDGKLHFAPTIRVWYQGDEGIARMDEARAYAARIRPIVERLDGFVTVEHEEETRIEVTVYIPVTAVATGRSAHPVDWTTRVENWNAAVADLLGDGSGNRVMAHFQPQVDLPNGYFTDTADRGEDHFDVTFEILLMGRPTSEEIEDNGYASDDLRDAIRSLPWIRDWNGPFTVTVADAVADFWADML